MFKSPFIHQKSNNMRTFYLLMSFMLLAFTANAQYVYTNFESSADEEFSGWPNVPTTIVNPDASGLNTSANVGEWVRSGDQWAHVYCELDGKIDFTESTSFMMKIWSPIACDILFKLEDKANAGIFAEVSQSISSTQEWVELSFDFSEAATGTFDKIIIFMDFATVEDHTFYFDDVIGPEYGTGTPPIAAHIYNDFDENQTDPIEGWPNVPTRIENPDASGINTSAYVGQWERSEEMYSHMFLEIPGRVDFTTGEVFYLKIWSPIACDVLFKLESRVDPNNFIESTQTITTASQWVELSFTFPGGASDIYDKIVIFPDFAMANNNTFFIDDLAGPSYAGGPGPKPLEATDVQDNFENDGYSTINDWKFQDPEMVDLTITEDPLNAANHVADYMRSGTFEWTNAQCVLDHRMDLSQRNVFEVKAYFPSTNTYSDQLTKTLAIKLQNSLLEGNAWSTQTEIILEVTEMDQWVDLVFDFSAVADSVNYDQIVVQFGGEGHFAAGTFYFDDFALMGGPGPKPLLATDVQDNFENDGTSTMHDWKFQDPEMMDLTIVEDPMNAENHVVDYIRSGDFEWANAQVILDHRMDLSERNQFELYVYFPSTNNYDEQLTPTAALKLQNSLLGGDAWSTQTEIKLEVTEFDAWVRLVFDYSAIADSANYDQIVVQLGGEGHFVPAEFYFDDIKLLGATGINEANYQTINIYPNPADQYIYMGQTFKSMRIYNMQGALVLEQEAADNSIQVGQLKAGVYFLTALSENGEKFSTRFIKK